MSPKSKRAKHEIYDISRSPFSQKPTQTKVADILGVPKSDLQRLVNPNYKQHFVVTRTKQCGKKIRELKYPTGYLRVIHEKLKYQLNKIVKPDYIFSPRKGFAQRDNALLHKNQTQYLTLDLKQFYPSTTSRHVRAWFEGLGMYSDVAGLLTGLATIDGKVSFGSPLTPVLCALVHRAMFDQIADLCANRGLNISVWVDDITISGNFIPGQLLRDIRGILQRNGLRSHKIEYRTGNRVVLITGIGVVGENLCAPSSLNKKIKAAWENLHTSESHEGKVDAIGDLLSLLGTQRYIVGPKSELGQHVSNEMNSLRQKRLAYLKRESKTEPLQEQVFATDECNDEELPW